MAASRRWTAAISPANGPASFETQSFDVSRVINIDAKRAIARGRSRCALTATSSSSTAARPPSRCRNSCATQRLKILTNSYPLAEFLIHETQNRVALPGGEVYREQKLIVAPFDDDAIQHYSARIMFMSAISIGPLGVIEGDPLIARAETKLLRRADKLVVLADASKFADARQPGRLSAGARFDALITDRNAPPEALAMLREAGVETIVVEPRRAAPRRPHEREADADGPSSAVAPLLEVRDIEKAFPGVRALIGRFVRRAGRARCTRCSARTARANRR